MSTLLAIKPNSPIVMPSAITVTSPPRPLEWVSPRIPVRVLGNPPEPSIDSMPETSTNTLPLFPAAPALVVLATTPSSVTARVPALTATLPALPLPKVVEAMPSNIEKGALTPRSIVADPPIITVTFPASPTPLATVPRDDPESMVREPAKTATAPPAPAGGRAPEVRQVGVAQDPARTFALLCRTSSPATMEIAPPRPAFEAVEKIPVERLNAEPPSATTVSALIAIGLPVPLARAMLVSAAPLLRVSRPVCTEIAPPLPEPWEPNVNNVLAPSTPIIPAGPVEMVTPAPLPLPVVTACTIAPFLNVI